MSDQASPQQRQQYHSVGGTPAVPLLAPAHLGGQLLDLCCALDPLGLCQLLLPPQQDDLLVQVGVQLGLQTAAAGAGHGRGSRGSMHCKADAILALHSANAPTALQRSSTQPPAHMQPPAHTCMVVRDSSAPRAACSASSAPTSLPVAFWKRSTSFLQAGRQGRESRQSSRRALGCRCAVHTRKLGNYGSNPMQQLHHAALLHGTAT